MNFWLKLWFWIGSVQLYLGSWTIIQSFNFLLSKNLKEEFIITKFSMVHQNLVHVTSFFDLKSPSLDLVTSSLKYTPNAVLKSWHSKLVTFIYNFVRKNTFLVVWAVYLFCHITKNSLNQMILIKYIIYHITYVSRKLVDTFTKLH